MRVNPLRLPKDAYRIIVTQVTIEKFGTRANKITASLVYCPFEIEFEINNFEIDFKINN